MSTFQGFQHINDITYFPERLVTPAGINNQLVPGRLGAHQGAPLTPQCQAIYEANLKNREAGGQGTDLTYSCRPDGMQGVMNVIFPMEIIILPKATCRLGHLEYSIR